MLSLLVLADLYMFNVQRFILDLHPTELKVCQLKHVLIWQIN